MSSMLFITALTLVLTVCAVEGVVSAEFAFTVVAVTVLVNMHWDELKPVRSRSMVFFQTIGRVIAAIFRRALRRK